MNQRRHHKHRQYLRSERTAKQKIRRIVAGALLAIVLVYFGKVTLNFFGVGNSIRKTAAILRVEGNGIINVSVDGGASKRAETELKLYAGDSVVSSPRNYANLDLFDGSYIRLDESTHVSIEKSQLGEEHSSFTIALEEGNLWMATPAQKVFSGSITRTIQSPYLMAEVPSTAEVVFSPRSLSVYAADGLGLTVTVAGSNQSVIIGEGQQFTIPLGGDLNADLYSYRNPLDMQQLGSTFVEESKAQFAGGNLPTDIVTTDEDEQPTGDSTLFVVDRPQDDSTTDSATVQVSGRVGSDIERVRINGYMATINRESGQFTQELALPDEDTVDIVIEAVDDTGVVIAQSLRTLTRNRKPPEPPEISAPAQSGQTYRTNQPEIEIRGTVGSDVVGVFVNDYRLQLFNPGDATWSYLASTKLNNFQPGVNVYEISGINAGGYRSPPAVATIVLGEGEEGVVSGDSEAEGTVNQPTTTTIEESELPQNDPLMPGSIAIYSPSTAREYETSEVENLIEGNVPPQTASVWVNGYRLRLYEPGKDFFNYIASVELSTQRRGRNVYRIVARDAENQILDEIEYVLVFNP